LGKLSQKCNHKKPNAHERMLLLSSLIIILTKWQLLNIVCSIGVFTFYNFILFVTQVNYSWWLVSLCNFGEGVGEIKVK